MKGGPADSFGQGPAQRDGCGTQAGAGRGAPDQRLGRGRRLTRPGSFQEAYAQGRRWVGRFMVFWLREGEDASLRLGVVTGRKVGGAVQRARARRLLREAFRRNRHRLSGKCDVVLVARRAILAAEWGELVDELIELAGRAGLTGGGGRVG